ncbi:hypothetical protein QEN19_002984 [Hanseniaspora menglaensis]
MKLSKTFSIFATFVCISSAINAQIQKKAITNNDIKHNSEDNQPRSIAEVCKKSYSLENMSQLNHLSRQCHTIKGSLNFNQFVDPIIDLGGIENIEGDLIMENSASIVRVECPNLKSIGGEFRIQALTSLNSINLKELDSVNSIYWRVVPILSIVDFTKGLRNINRLTISDTSLAGFEGFEKDKVNQLTVLDINNNRFMEFINCNVKSVSEKLSLQSNAKEIKVSLNNLVWANNMTVKDTSAIFIPNLQYVNNSLEFIDNHFQLIDMPKLEGIGGTLSIDSNKELNKVNMNNVSNILGGIMISKNDQLDSIDFLKSLLQIGGAIQFSGKIQKINFPKLKLVKGSVYINSTSDELDCSSWISPPNGISIIRGGKIICSSSKKQTKISLSDKGEVLDSDTTDLDTSKNHKDISKKNSALKMSQSIKVPVFLSFITIFLSIIMTFLE